jgi:hypothetical protein
MTLTAEEKEVYVTIWSKVVDTQMHFNEMSVKARQFGLAFVAAALGLAVVLASRGQESVINVPYFGGFKIHASVFIAAASAVALYAVKLLDLKVYHRMLRGAVAFGEDFEQSYMKEIFNLEKGMTQAISHFSRHDDARVVLREGKYEYTGNKMLRAEAKISRFYTFTIWALSFLALALFLATSDMKFLRDFRADVPINATSAQASQHGK